MPDSNNNTPKDSLLQIDVEYQYQKYLTLVGYDESTLHPTQAKEMRNVFFGAFGQLLILQRNTISNFPDDKAVEQLEYLENQVREHFKNL